MGGAAGTLPDNSVLKTALQRQLDAFYQEKVKEGLNDVQLQEAVTKEYLLMVEAIKSGQGHEKAAQHQPNITLKNYQHLMDLAKEHDPIHYPMPQKSPRGSTSRKAKGHLSHPLLEKESHRHLTTGNIRRRSFADLTSKVTTEHKLRESDIEQFVVLYGHDDPVMKRRNSHHKMTLKADKDKKHDGNHEKNDTKTSSRHTKNKAHKEHEEHTEGSSNDHDSATSQHSNKSSTSGMEKPQTPQGTDTDKATTPEGTLADKPARTKELPPYTWFTEPSDWELDSWDSVVHQPKCFLCKRAFKTNERLDHHVKYDADHKQNQLKVGKELEEQQFKEAQRLKLLNHTHDTLYNGMKTFYKTKTHVYLKLILHLAGRMIEVVPVHCSAEKGQELGQFKFTYGKELNRLYFPYDKVLDVVAIIHQALKDTAPHVGEGDREKSIVHMSLPPGENHDLHSDELHKLVTQHILSHLQVTLVPTTNSAKALGDSDTATKPVLSYGTLITDEVQYNTPEIPASELPKWMVTPIASGGTVEPPPPPLVQLAAAVPEKSPKVEPIGKTVQDLTAFLEKEKDYIEHVHEAVEHSRAAATNAAAAAAAPAARTEPVAAGNTTTTASS